MYNLTNNLTIQIFEERLDDIPAKAHSALLAFFIILLCSTVSITILIYINEIYFIYKKRDFYTKKREKIIEEFE